MKPILISGLLLVAFIGFLQFQENKTTEIAYSFKPVLSQNEVQQTTGFTGLLFRLDLLDFYLDRIYWIYMIIFGVGSLNVNFKEI